MGKTGGAEKGGLSLCCPEIYGKTFGKIGFSRSFSEKNQSCGEDYGKCPEHENPSRSVLGPLYHASRPVLYPSTGKIFSPAAVAAAPFLCCDSGREC